MQNPKNIKYYLFDAVANDVCVKVRRGSVSGAIDDGKRTSV